MDNFTVSVVVGIAALVGVLLLLVVLDKGAPEEDDSAKQRGKKPN